MMLDKLKVDFIDFVEFVFSHYINNWHLAVAFESRWSLPSRCILSRRKLHKKNVDTHEVVSESKIN